MNDAECQGPGCCQEEPCARRGLKLREVGDIEGRPSKFNTLAKLLEAEGPAYVRGYLRGALAVARQLDPSGALATRVRQAVSLQIATLPAEVADAIREDIFIW